MGLELGSSKQYIIQAKARRSFSAGVEDNSQFGYVTMFLEYTMMRNIVFWVNIWGSPSKQAASSISAFNWNIVNILNELTDIVTLGQSVIDGDSSKLHKFREAAIHSDSLFNTAQELWQQILISSFAQPPDSASICQVRRTYYHIKALARKINSKPETVTPHEYVSSYPTFPNITSSKFHNNLLHSATPNSSNKICNPQPSPHSSVTKSTAFPSAPSSVKQPVSRKASHRLPMVSASTYSPKHKNNTRKSSPNHRKPSHPLRNQRNSSPCTKSSPSPSSSLHGHLQGRALNQSKPTSYPSILDVGLAQYFDTKHSIVSSKISFPTFKLRLSEFQRSSIIPKLLPLWFRPAAKFDLLNDKISSFHYCSPSKFERGFFLRGAPSYRTSISSSLSSYKLLAAHRPIHDSEVCVKSSRIFSYNSTLLNFSYAPRSHVRRNSQLQLSGTKESNISDKTNSSNSSNLSPSPRYSDVAAHSFLTFSLLPSPLRPPPKPPPIKSRHASTSARICSSSPTASYLIASSIAF
ncbi:hypothetical protein O3M35_012495 [Rhynocoris fuscipes]|uniref:Uncharacterized protein n=1 Tax=Rhynocoris fuscipes TaxID=488301 RepID=A0AAW1CTP5_9HEMI